MDTKVVVVLVMGLPGSGKTTLCKAIRSHLKEDRERQLIHICYDDLIPLAVQREFVERRRRIREVEGRYLLCGEKKEEEEEVEIEERNNVSERETNSEVNDEEKERKEERYLVCEEKKKEEEEEVEIEERNIVSERENGNEINDKEKERKGEGYLVCEEKKKEKKEEEEEVEIEERNIVREREKSEGKSNTKNTENEEQQEHDEEQQEDQQQEHEEKQQEEHEEEQIPDDWKRARRNIHTQLDRLLHYLNAGTTNGDTNDKLLGIPLSSLLRATTGRRHIILLDDNFYYRSMRYEFHQLARKHSAAFCQLYLECRVADAISRNDSREHKVPTDVVAGMGAKFQPPQPYVNAWEGNTCTLGSGDLPVALEVIEKSFRRGLKPVENREAEIVEARKRCSLSVIHQADLTLRSVVKRLVMEELEKPGNAPKSTVAGNVNKARKAVLQDLKGGLSVPRKFAEEITQENRLEFEVFLEGEMRRKMVL